MDEPTRADVRQAILAAVIWGTGYSAPELARDERKRTWCERAADKIMRDHFGEEEGRPVDGP